MPLWSKLGLLATLYLSQGLPFGFFTQALPVLLRQQGLSLPAIGLTSLLALPWALKYFWSPLVDRYAPRRLGARRGWILPLQGAAVLTLLGIALVDPEHALSWVLAGVLLTNLLAATQDIATDALAVDLLKPDERGPGNAVQVAGYRVGMIVGGGGLLIVFGSLGWANTFGVMALILAIASVPILLYRERQRPPAPQHRDGYIAITLDSLRRPGMAAWLAILLLYKGPDALASGMLRPMLVDLGYGIEDVGWMLGTVGFTAGLLGALGGGWGVRWLGRHRALLLFGVFQALAVGAYALPAAGLDHPDLMLVFIALDHFAGGTATVALFTAMMDTCRPAREATDYTLQASVVVVGAGLAGSLSGFSAEALGYTAHFAGSAALTLAGLGIVALLLKAARLPSSDDGKMEP